MVEHVERPAHPEFFFDVLRIRPEALRRSKKPLHHLKQDHILPKSTGVLCCGTSASKQMDDQKHDTQNEDDVNESGGNVKCEKAASWRCPIFRYIFLKLS